MSTRPNPRRRDAIAKAAAIENAAVDLVLAHGYDAVTVEMICAVAGVSQRTFFNHFKTKDLALIGTEAPSIDRDAARSFVDSRGPLLIEATQLIRLDAGSMTDDPALMARRIRAVSTNPALMARQMERLAFIEREMSEIIELRLRTQYPAEDHADIREQAQIITHLLAGLMRYLGQSWARQVQQDVTPHVDPLAITEALHLALKKLG